MEANGISNELKSKAQWVADLMKADGVAPDQVTPELALAYFEEVGRKSVKIQNIYLTNPAAKSVLQARVLQACR